MPQVSEPLDTASASPHATYLLDAYDALPGVIKLVLCMLPVLEGMLMLEAVDAMLRMLEPVLVMTEMDLMLSMLRPGRHSL
jgi:hypothetical protein